MVDHYEAWIRSDGTAGGAIEHFASPANPVIGAKVCVLFMLVSDIVD